MGTILKAKDILGNLNNEIKTLRSNFVKKAPKLVCVSVGEDMGTQSYLNSIRRVLTNEYSIDLQVIDLPQDSNEAEVLSIIDALNSDREVTAIMLMRPLPSHLNLKNVQKHILPCKDVDGVTPFNEAGFWTEQEGAFGSCTAQAALYTLQNMVDTLRGLDVVVVGRSHEVGRPIAELLTREDSTVTLCHSATDDLTSHLRSADAVISCTGVAHLIDGSMLKEGAYVVDVGMSMLDGILVGDVDIDTAIEKVSYITPAIGGVGAVTTHMLALHIMQAAIMQQ